ARERTGNGQHVKLAMLDAVIAFLWPEGMAAYTFESKSNAVIRQALRDLVFDTADGFITAGALSDAEWAGMARALGHPEWIDDSRFKTPADRIKNVDVRLEVTAGVLKTKSSADWIRLLDAEQVPCAPILSREDLLHDPQVAANGLIVESEHPHAGRMRQPRPAARFETASAAIARPAPLLGEHTDAILREIGLGDSEITRLRDTGAVA
ncbi:MAG TPA: CoA transferase, partial [Candidatus Binataceae bacterium]